MSLAEDRHKQAQQICELWLRLKAGERRSGEFTDDQREELLVSKLVELCIEEIVLALNDDPVGRVLYGIWLIVDYKHNKAGWIGSAAILRVGVSRALYAKLKGDHADIVSLIKPNVARELAERRDEKVRWLKSLKAKDLLPELLGLIQHNQHYNVAIFVDHLTGTQRSDLECTQATPDLCQPREAIRQITLLSLFKSSQDAFLRASRSRAAPALPGRRERA